jgi:hypothetical protein
MPIRILCNAMLLLIACLACGAKAGVYLVRTLNVSAIKGAILRMFDALAYLFFCLIDNWLSV